MSMIFRELGCYGTGGLLSFQIIVCNQKFNDFCIKLVVYTYA